MARYRKVDPVIWHDTKFRGLHKDSQLLFLYLLTSPHSTAWGIYVIDNLYIQADTGLSQKQISDGVSELLASRLILRCDKNRLVAFPNWFKFNRPENEKSIMACINGILSLPQCPVLFEFCSKSDWVSEQLANRCLSVSEKLGSEQ